MAIKKAPMGVDKDLSTRIDALDGAGEVELTMLAANAEGKVIVYNGSQVATAVAMSGDVTIAANGAVTIANDAVEQAMVADDAVGAAQLKVVVRDVTVAGGASTGTVTNAADINGVVLGVRPSNAESAVKTVALTAVDGKLDVTMNSAQAGGQDAHIFVSILQV